MSLFPNPPAWSASTAYQAGVDEVTESNLIYLCSKSGTSGSSAPSWPDTFGSSVTDGTCTWTLVQNARQSWQSDHAYTSGALNTSSTPYPWPDQVVEESSLGLWQCTVSGTSGSSAPSWPSSPDWPPNEPPNNYSQPTISDGSVTWALVAYDGE